ncbi:RNase H domain-containing protein [Trichonephila clavipes]|nr:RNase H domain-containing protein [Trichonephila clavipes]
MFCNSPYKQVARVLHQREPALRLMAKLMANDDSSAFKMLKTTSGVTSFDFATISIVWQETWEQQILNKLHSLHPSTSHWAALPVRRHDVRLTQLRIGHTRFTHSHLLLGENAPKMSSCKVPYSVYHIFIDCPVFNRHRVTFFIHLF